MIPQVEEDLGYSTPQAIKPVKMVKVGTKWTEVEE